MSPIAKELMKGTAELIVLQALSDHGESYGYDLVKYIGQRSGEVFSMREGTLYPVLYRLEDRGLVVSQRKKAPSGKERRYYTITESGNKVLLEKKKEWRVFSLGMRQALKFE